MKREWPKLSYWDTIRKMGRKVAPMCSYAMAKGDFDVWSAKAYEQFCGLLGLLPKEVPLRPRIIETKKLGNVIREKIIFSADDFSDIPCYVMYPVKVEGNEKLPSIICVHGHGPMGKNAVVGLASSSEEEKIIKDCNYNYAEQMARAGFLTISPDLRGFGERRDVPYDNPDDFNVHGDGMRYECTECSSNYVRLSVMGIYPLALSMWDMKRCVDYLLTRDDVLGDNIGIMGLSLGGTVACFSAAYDKRIKACDVIGYVNPMYRFGIDRYYSCGSQILPDLYKYLDVPDIAGLIAKRPLLLEMGRNDEIFPFSDLYEGYLAVKEIYSGASADDKLWIDIHEGGHAFSGKEAIGFFRKYLEV